MSVGRRCAYSRRVCRIGSRFPIPNSRFPIPGFIIKKRPGLGRVSSWGPARCEGGGYLLFRFRSTIGVAGFNFSVRNGKRWSPRAITTLVLSQSGCWRLWRLLAAVFAVPAVEGGKKGVWKPGAGLSDRLATCFLARGGGVCLATNFFLGKGLGD